MISRFAAHKKFGHLEGFNWRGEEPSRIEGLSDAVFAFAVTLLIVSLEVPKTFDDLLRNLSGFFSFAACFAQLMIVWYQQYVFFRRYNLEDFQTIVLTMVLLFVVLFYIYPLKFLFTALLTPWLLDKSPMLQIEDARLLMTIYGAGFIAVNLVIYYQYRHAWKVRELLELNAVEDFDTRDSMMESLIYIGFGVVSITFANLADGELAPMLSGFTYALIGPVFWWSSDRSAKKRKKVLESMEDELVLP